MFKIYDLTQNYSIWC